MILKIIEYHMIAPFMIFATSDNADRRKLALGE
jgi:hypothetical protein